MKKLRKFLSEIRIIQGGMGVKTADWRLARTVSKLSKKGRRILGTVSGTALDEVVVLMLKKNGEDAAEICRIWRNSPRKIIRDMGEEIIERYLGKPNASSQMFSFNPPRKLIELNICANYAFAALAKEGHDEWVSMNYLEKIAMPHLSSIFGAMLAGIDFITMGAGIPHQIPGVIDAFMEGRPATYKIPVIGGEDFEMVFDPKEFFGEEIILTKRPGFIPIVSSVALAQRLCKTLKGKIYGFVVEEPTAGGHNAPPRNKIEYGEKDIVDYNKIAELGLPFWIGGSYASPKKLMLALSKGACGIQVGSIFAFCEDSGMDPTIRKLIQQCGFNGRLEVFTDYHASPTGFPFKVLLMEGTVSDEEIYLKRKRVCNRGALRVAYKKADGSYGYRCPSEPIKAYLLKGGKIEDTVGRKCVCNGLVAKAGLRLENELQHEPAIITAGDQVAEKGNDNFFKHLMRAENLTYYASDALKYLLRDYNRRFK